MVLSPAMWLVLRLAPLLREGSALRFECGEALLMTKQVGVPPRASKHKKHRQTGQHQCGESRCLWFANL